MAEITVDFKFNVGDFVRLKQDLRAYELMSDDKKRYIPKCQQFMIVERTYNQCYNTSQNHYALRSYEKTNGAPNLHSYVEVELELAP